MFRTSIAAAALVLAAATPSFADGFGYDARKPNYEAQKWQDDDASSKPADYSSRDEHCAKPGKVVVEENGYDGKYAPKYGYGYPKYGYRY